MQYSRSSALEVGCNTGVTLRLLRELNPGMKLAGVDVNKPAIESGRRLSPDIEFAVGSVRAIPHGDKSFDVVFTDACLIYVAPDAIVHAIRECQRVARTAVVIREWNEVGPSRAVTDHWLHDWAALGARLEPAYPQSPEWERWGVIGHFMDPLNGGS